MVSDSDAQVVANCMSVLQQVHSLPGRKGGGKISNSVPQEMQRQVGGGA